MLDYKEYIAMLTPQLEVSGPSRSISDASDPGEAEPKAEARQVPKIEPFGGEEIREVFIKRKQLAQARVREERYDFYDITLCVCMI